nr:helix-turn-helix domain-containing protein [Streptomyces sp. HNM0575]
MVESVFRSEDVPAADRFSHWREHMAQAYAPTEIHADHVEDFSACQRTLSLGAVQLWTMEHPALTLRRTPKLIRRSDPELYHLSLVRRGTMGLTELDREITYAPYDLVLLDTSRPYSIQAITGHGHRRIAGTGAFLPREALPLPRKSIDTLITRRLSGRDGIGALLADMLTRLAADAGSYRPSDGPRLGTVVADLLTALLAHAVDADNSLPEQARWRTLVLRIQAFIEQNLRDPELTPRGIAVAHHISLSYLHRLFRYEDETVAAWIRNRRLEKTCRDLADPGMRATPIHAIAARWGFVRAADFTRAFRAAYGRTPSDYRREALDVRQCTHC